MRDVTAQVTITVPDDTEDETVYSFIDDALSEAADRENEDPTIPGSESWSIGIAGRS